MNVAIVGCGAIGHKRAQALGQHRLLVCADMTLTQADRLAAEFPGCAATSDLQLVVGDPAIDLVIVATSNDALATVGMAAIEAGKHVLIEKPAARSAAELRPLVEAAARRGVVARAGFNHRFHPAFLRARQIYDSGSLGPLLYLRARYGHGGRLGYEHEWRADRARAGGGELLDQGSHLIDLARWFAGDFVEVVGHVGTYFWPMQVEDNAFVMLKTAASQIAWLHASWSEWKNIFSFEIFCRGGKLQIDGLGGSYGTERLTEYRMLPEMGPPETTAWEYPWPDRSWELEVDDVIRATQTGHGQGGRLDDALAVLETCDRLYGRGADHDHLS